MRWVNINVNLYTSNKTNITLEMIVYFLIWELPCPIFLDKNTRNITI